MRIRLTIVSAALLLCTAGWTAQAQNGQDHGTGKTSGRFEVKSLKAVRPKLVNLVSAIQKKDAAAAKAAFEAYDGASATTGRASKA